MATPVKAKASTSDKENKDKVEEGVPAPTEAVAEPVAEVKSKIVKKAPKKRMDIRLQNKRER